MMTSSKTEHRLATSLLCCSYIPNADKRYCSSHDFMTGLEDDDLFFIT